MAINQSESRIQMYLFISVDESLRHYSFLSPDLDKHVMKKSTITKMRSGLKKQSVKHLKTVEDLTRHLIPSD